jgi:RNA polymerase sigma factor (sigma-70 family)
MTPDGELLRRYAEADSEEAFAELVRRRLDLVYSAALRQVNRDTRLAQEVAQSVFTDLARKATALSRRQDLAGWLYTSTRFAAAKAVRTERRRQTREQEALAMRELLHTPAPGFDWERLRPVLDEAMHELKDSDREVILIRYFENLRLSEVGIRLGVAEDTARKRVDRALEKLRAALAKHGLPSAVSLSTALSAHAVQKAHAGLAAAITGASLADAAAGTGATLALCKFMAASKLKSSLLGVLLLAGVLTPLLLQYRALAGLRGENLSLRRRAAQLARLPAENLRLSGLLAAGQSTKAVPSEQFSELLRLRGQAGVQKDEMRKVRAELAARPVPNAPRVLLGSASTNFFPKGSWASAGYATPEATIQSLSWAISRSDVTALLACLSPQAQATLATHFEGKSDGEIAAEIAGEASQFQKVEGLRIVNEKMVSDEEVFITVYNDGTDSWGSMRMKRYGNQWIISGFPQSP